MIDLKDHILDHIRGCIHESILDTDLSMDMPSNLFPDGTVTLDIVNEYLKEAEEVVIPEGVHTIENGAFMFMPALRKIILPKTLVRIGSAAFNKCRNLEEVIFPKKMAEPCMIGDRVFYECSKLKVLELPANTDDIGTDVFNRTGLDKLVIPRGADLNYRALAGTNCREIDLGDCIGLSLPGGLFEDSPRLEKVVLPRRLKTISQGAFKGCIALKEVVYKGTGITDIRSRAFQGCKSLVKLSLPGSISISDWVFEGCIRLRDLDIDVESCGPDTFTNCKVLKVIRTSQPDIEYMQDSLGRTSNANIEIIKI